MDVQQSLVAEAEAYVRRIFSEEVPAAYVYHNLQHTLGVVEAVQIIMPHYDLTDAEKEALLLAAWFHDTGYSRSYEDHETASAGIAAEFLSARGACESLIQLVRETILSTRMPQSPHNLAGEILCDADLYHLGTDAFTEGTKALRKELNLVLGKELGKKEWRRKNLDFLQQHRYFTSWAREHLEPGKQAHILSLEEKLRPPQTAPVQPQQYRVAAAAPTPPLMPGAEASEEDGPAPGASKKEKIREKEKLAKTERGIATMFRIMSDNHVSLSQMADSKANIMISVNTIVLSILVSVLLGKLQYYPQFILPTIILAGSCLLAVVFAILATRPNVTKGVFSESDIRQKKVNLLFFGNFFKMELPDYEWAMTEMMNDREYLYGSMIKDIYYLGKVLARKYRFLRIAYNIFMFGLILSILAFGIAGFLGVK